MTKWVFVKYLEDAQVKPCEDMLNRNLLLHYGKLPDIKFVYVVSKIQPELCVLSRIITIIE